ncbi:LOW QUALITY PROTEIN: hypothetical protein TorRG33x02_299300 [Trema orientale]|uniref:Uncharacterized protein n=1 Tax=Trema orientale TaxID=63057 RepID=A0A2P5C2Z8_TREOI|nr:LOW QUALITY PROTEIN: hypothetical protein TorRG33x02_299300 [Trema orientale]
MIHILCAKIYAYMARRWESGGTCGWGRVGEGESMKPLWRCKELFGFRGLTWKKGKEPISSTLDVHIWTFGLECNKAADWAGLGFQIWLLTTNFYCLYIYISFSLSHGDYIERFVLSCSLAFKFDTILYRNSFIQNDHW